MFQDNTNEMSVLSARVWRAFTLSEMPFYHADLSYEPPAAAELLKQPLGPLPSSGTRCLVCRNVEIIIDGNGRMEAVAWCICHDEEEEEDWTLCQCLTCAPNL